MRPYQKSQIGAAMWKRVWGQKVFVLAWSGAAFAMVMLTLAGIGHAEDRVAATDLRVERHPTLAGTYMAIMKIKNIGSTPWSNIPYRFMDNGQPVVSRSDTRTVRPQEETTVSWSFPLSPGSHAIVGIADPGFTLGEREGSERYNNALSRTVEVPPPSDRHESDRGGIDLVRPSSAGGWPTGDGEDADQEREPRHFGKRALERVDSAKGHMGEPSAKCGSTI